MCKVHDAILFGVRPVKQVLSTSFWNGQFSKFI
jgi:hypothetical protein